ncbi:hypothetical protein Tco_0939575 [Tanacetum coccineum]|uniref:Reverse transcriptase domain-containing protein n=1 Tax=Tanacetum coccineum TaxID=301880 RepID=A0ABQ5DKH2_9ASTR
MVTAGWRWLWCCGGCDDDIDDGDGLEVVLEVIWWGGRVTAAGARGGGVARDSQDRVDRESGSIFGVLAGKSPEKRRQQQTLPVVENFDLEDPIVEQNVVPMADNRTMAQMLQAPIEGYEDAIVVPPINANNFELKQPLSILVQSNMFSEVDAPLSNSSLSNNSFDMQQIAASLEDKMTIKMNQMMNQMKALVVTTPAPVKAVEEVCVTCGSLTINLCP